MNSIKNLLLVGVVFSSLFWAMGAIAGEGVLIVKVLDHQAEPNDGVVIDRVTFSKGLPPVNRLNKSGQNTPYEFQILNNAGQIIYTQTFDFTRHLEVPLPQPGSRNREEVSRVLLKEPEAVLIVPYLSEGIEVRVMGPRAVIQPTPVPAKPVDQPEESSFPSPAPAQEGNFYILLIASGFSNMTDFQTKAQETKEDLLNTEPFFSRSSEIIVSTYENGADLGCNSGCYNIDRLMCCDSAKVMASAVASGQLYDEIVIIHDTTTYSGGGYRDYGSYQTNSTSSYCMVYNGSWTAPMMLHEFGHSFGNLCDEYAYGSEDYSYYDCANCRASCSDWSNVSAVCQIGCDARSDYYRPEDSIMLSLGISSYNMPSIHNALIPRLNYFIPPYFEGDINHDHTIDLTDAILGLQIVSGVASSVPVFTSADVNNDEMINIQEVIYILQSILQASSN